MQEGVADLHHRPINPAVALLGLDAPTAVGVAPPPGCT